MLVLLAAAVGLGADDACGSWRLASWAVVVVASGSSTWQADSELVPIGGLAAAACGWLGSGGGGIGQRQLVGRAIWRQRRQWWALPTFMSLHIPRFSTCDFVPI